MEKKNSIWIYFLVTMVVLFIFMNSCKKEAEKGEVPVLTTSSVSQITPITATCGGEITSDGGAAIIARGVCWSIGTTPTISDSKSIDGAGGGSFTSKIDGLTGNTTYFIRAYATTAKGTGYGMALSFTTKEGVADNEGNVYHGIMIGTQVWLVENLKTTKYRNGDLIPNITDNTQWSTLITGAYCDYANISSSSYTYGKLYNWFAVNDSRNIAPIGWHVATYDEWTALISYLGGEDVAGGKLKEEGTTHWKSPNKYATNLYGFTALPGGSRSSLAGIFNNLHNDGWWWTSTKCNSPFEINTAWNTNMSYYDARVIPVNNNYACAFSVRCVKD